MGSSAPLSAPDQKKQEIGILSYLTLDEPYCLHREPLTPPLSLVNRSSLSNLSSILRMSGDRRIDATPNLCYTPTVSRRNTRSHVKKSIRTSAKGPGLSRSGIPPQVGGDHPAGKGDRQPQGCHPARHQGGSRSRRDPRGWRAHPDRGPQSVHNTEQAQRRPLHHGG